MPAIPDKSVDLILCDLPYEKTRGFWDSTIPFEPLWLQYNRIITDSGAIILFGNEPFSSRLRLSNEALYKYDIKWVKNRATGFANCNHRPMNKYEDIMVFSKANASVGGRANPMTYNPQGLEPSGKVKTNVAQRHGLIHEDTNNIGEANVFSSGTQYVQKYTNYPSNVHFADVETTKNFHPTQKPCALFEFLVLTFSNEGELVLDSCAGSGTTGVACANTGRDFILIEKEPKYVERAIERLST